MVCAGTLFRRARKILDEYQNGSLQFFAPDLLAAEFGNIVWKKQQFHGLDDSDAQSIMDAFHKLNFTLVSSVVLLQDAYRIAVQQRRSVYDALYIALSVKENCRLVTADERLVNAISTSIPNLVWLPNW